MFFFIILIVLCLSVKPLWSKATWIKARKQPEVKKKIGACVTGELESGAWATRPGLPARGLERPTVSVDWLSPWPLALKS